MTITPISPDHTRLLLLLWSEEGLVKKGDLLQRLLKQHERRKKYQAILDELLEVEAVALIGSKSAQVQLLPQGEMLLAEGLQDERFEFGSQVGGRLANALLKWIRRQAIATPKASIVDHNGSHNGAGKSIVSYEEFKNEALQQFSALNNQYTYSGLVPIWHLREQLNNRVDRQDFNNWLMEMQAEQIFYLQTGEAIGATEEQKRNSIESEVRGLLFYVSQPA